jgi:hypothetical protein
MEAAMEFFVILTVNLHIGLKTEQFTFSKVLTPGRDATREDLFRTAKSQIPSEFAARGTVVFFSAEPNPITA